MPHKEGAKSKKIIGLIILYACRLMHTLFSYMCLSSYEYEVGKHNENEKENIFSSGNVESTSEQQN